MTLSDFMAFKGNAKELEDYKGLIKKRDQLARKIRKLSNDIQFEDDAVQVLTDFSETEKDAQALRQHKNTRAKLSVKQDKYIKEYNQIIDFLNEYTTR